MEGISTRFAFKILAKVFNYDSTEVAANPVHLMYVLERQIEREQFPAELETKYIGFIKEYLSQRYAEFIGKEIQTAYLESYSEYGQNIFDRYVTYADYWIQDSEYRDTDTGEVFDRNALNAELEKVEKPAGIANPRTSAMRSSTLCCGPGPTTRARTRAWTSYEKLRVVIEKKMFSNTEEPAARHQLQRQGQRRGRAQARGLRHPYGGQGLYAQAGAPALRVVSARAQEQLTEGPVVVLGGHRRDD